MKKLLVVVCTQRSKDESGFLLAKSSLDLLKHEVVLKIHYENKTPLPVIYNQYISNKWLKKHDIVLFVHDDVYIDDLKLRGKLYGAIKQFDIIGLAGCINPTLKAPVLWHLMSPKTDHRGYVAHAAPEDPNIVNMVSYGHTPSRVAIADGLFLAVNIKSALKAEWKFNENFSFHHYDISSCIDANRKRLKIGVIPVNVIHASRGLENYNDPTFQSSQDKFLEIYS
tara:strand:- start:236 stop:910 length:675 start_codon:yes stop_codon:yes gene_type:complete